jgi:hypothetical protein
MAPGAADLRNTRKADPSVVPCALFETREEAPASPESSVTRILATADKTNIARIRPTRDLVPTPLAPRPRHCNVEHTAADTGTPLYLETGAQRT